MYWHVNHVVEMHTLNSVFSTNPVSLKDQKMTLGWKMPYFLTISPSQKLKIIRGDATTPS